jgi:methionyl aminopeptidase
MIILKSLDEIDRLRKSNRLVAETMDMLRGRIKPGVATEELDRLANAFIEKRGAKAAFKGYMGYKHTLCISINEQVVHGIPSSRKIEEGDIVGIDCGVLMDGFYGDHAWTFAVGRISENAQRLLETAEKALMDGISASTVEHRLFDISHAIQRRSEEAGFSVVRDFVGHGIGTSLHEDPQVPNFGDPDTGMKLKSGLTLALEPMLNEGGYAVEVLEDGWTVVTKDRKLSAHFEHTIAITDSGPEILSAL